MTDSDLDVWMLALFGEPDELRPTVTRTDLEDRIVSALKNDRLRADAKTALQDALLLFHELTVISQRKGADRVKAWEVYQRLDLRNGKHRLRKVRDMMACDVIQSELYRLGKKRLPAHVRDVMAYLLGMPGKPSGVTKIWREGRADAGRRVKHELKKEYIAFLKDNVRQLTESLERSPK